jgi:hypothetical protein
MPNKVRFELDFERYNTASEKYRIVPSVWVFTKKGHQWAIEFRPLMTPSFEL